MQDEMQDGGFERPALRLADVCPSLVNNLIYGLEILNRHDLAEQMTSVYVPKKLIEGALEKFSFMAYPIPRLNLERRKVVELKDPKIVKLEFDGYNVHIDIDEFGIINWFYVLNYPLAYTSIAKFLST